MNLLFATIILPICTNHIAAIYQRHNINRKYNDYRRIINGKETSIEKYRFAVAYVDHSTKFDLADVMCYGAAIIHKYWAITSANVAAHIPMDIMYYFLIHGNSAYLKGPGSRTHNITGIRWYESLMPLSSNMHDIALLQVLQPFVGVNEVPIPIAPPDYKYKVGSTAEIMGWGYSRIGENILSNRLRVTQVKIWDSVKCKKLYTWANYQNGGLLKIFVTNTTFCAWARKRGHCNGDNGGPVVQNGKLIGIISLRTDCASSRFPFVYTKISVFHDWIQKIISN